MPNIFNNYENIIIFSKLAVIKLNFEIKQNYLLAYNKEKTISTGKMQMFDKCSRYERRYLRSCKANKIFYQQFLKIL